MERSAWQTGIPYLRGCLYPGTASVSSAPLPLQVDAESPVAIFAENKDHAIAVGLTKMSTKDIREINKDIGVENVHYLNDGLWKNNKFV